MSSENPRVIKVRGWDDDIKQMLPPVDLSAPKSAWTWLGAKDVVLMQFTGLVDSDGVEWFEGDILGLNDPEGRSRCYIIFEDGAFQKRFTGPGRAFTNGLRIPFDLTGFWHVIGNIYENPELINQ